MMDINNDRIRHLASESQKRYVEKQRENDYMIEEIQKLKNENKQMIAISKELQNQNKILFSENMELKKKMFEKSQENEDLNNALKQALRRLGEHESLQDFLKECRVVGSKMEHDGENGEYLEESQEYFKKRYKKIMISHGHGCSGKTTKGKR